MTYNCVQQGVLSTLKLKLKLISSHQHRRNGSIYYFRYGIDWRLLSLPKAQAVTTKQTTTKSTNSSADTADPPGRGRPKKKKKKTSSIVENLSLQLTDEENTNVTVLHARVQSPLSSYEVARQAKISNNQAQLRTLFGDDITKVRSPIITKVRQSVGTLLYNLCAMDSPP